MVNLTIVGRAEFQDSLANLTVVVSRGMELATKEGAEFIKAAIEENMHGSLPPKSGGSDPASRTGNLIESLSIKPLAGGVGLGRWQYEISMDTTKAPYAARIELGFHGTDSIGRTYNQPAYPYFFKGVETAIGAGAVDDIFFRNLEEAVR